MTIVDTDDREYFKLEQVQVKSFLKMPFKGITRRPPCLEARDPLGRLRKISVICRKLIKVAMSHSTWKMDRLKTVTYNFDATNLGV